MRKILFILLLAPFALKSQTVNTFRDSTWFKRGVRFDSTLVFSKGAGVGKVWTSNANGTGSWQTFSSAGVTQGALDDSISAVRAIRKVDTIYKSLDSIVFKINGIRYAVLDSTGGGVQTLSISGDTLSISGGNSVVLPVYVQVDSATVTSYDVLNSQNAPPVSPNVGDVYLVGNSPSGAWVGHVKDIAEWNGSAWIFTDGVQGDFLYNSTTALTYIFRSGNWVQTTGIPILNNGNSINSGLRIGTNNLKSLTFETNNVPISRFDSIGNFYLYNTPNGDINDTFVVVQNPINGKLSKIGKSNFAGGGGGTPAGSDTQIQYNNAGAFGADSGFTRTSTGVTNISSTFGTDTFGYQITDNLLGLGVKGSANTWTSTAGDLGISGLSYIGDTTVNFTNIIFYSDGHTSSLELGKNRSRFGAGGGGLAFGILSNDDNFKVVGTNSGIEYGISQSSGAVKLGDIYGGNGTSITIDDVNEQITIGSDPNTRGLLGSSDYSANITDLDYTQKIYVDQRIADTANVLRGLIPDVSNFITGSTLTDSLAKKTNKLISFNTYTTSDTLRLSDADKVIEMNVGTANNLVIPNYSDYAFQVGTQITVIQIGSGQTTFVPASGVTISSAGGKLKLTGQYSTASLIKRSNTLWYLFGDITN